MGFTLPAPVGNAMHGRMEKQNAPAGTPAGARTVPGGQGAGVNQIRTTRLDGIGDAVFKMTFDPDTV